MSETWVRKQHVNPIHSYERTWQRIVASLATDGFTISRQDLTFYSNFKSEYRSEAKHRLFTPLDRASLLKQKQQQLKKTSQTFQPKQLLEVKRKPSFRRVTQSTETTNFQLAESPDKMIFSKQISQQKPVCRPLSSFYRSRQTSNKGNLPPPPNSTRLITKSNTRRVSGRPFIPPPQISAFSYIIMETPQNNIAALNSQISVQMASLTKIMTCVVCLRIVSAEELASTVVIGCVQTSITGTTAGLKKGFRYSIQQLLYGLMLPSGNDASLALAVWGGRLLHLRNQNLTEASSTLSPIKKRESISVFIRQMNLVAEQLGLKKTRYANPHGLSNSNNKSTALDIALLCKYAFENFPLFRKIVGTRNYTSKITDLQGKIQEISWNNTHKLLKKPQYNGIKTGVTTTAGCCLASHIKICNREFIIVVLGCKTLEKRFRQTEILKRWLIKREGLRPNKEEEVELSETMFDQQEQLLNDDIND